MPLPFILAGVALAAAGYGVKKGFDAKEDFDTAKSVNNEAKALFDLEKEKLEAAHAYAKLQMEQLGQAKLYAYQTLVLFIDVFEKIQNIEFDDAKIQEIGLVEMTPSRLKELKKVALEMKETIGAGVTSLGAGGLAGLAAYGAVGTFAAASTGTAIAGLSGVAATNATLAWLGGGSLAAGGFGMAGGMAVLGGVVTGPVLAVGGAILASKAEEAKHNAYENLANAKIEIEVMKEAIVITNAIRVQFSEVSNVIKRLQAIFDRLFFALKALVTENTEYRTYSAQEKELVRVTFYTAAALKQILEVQLLTENGLPTSISERISDLIKFTELNESKSRKIVQKDEGDNDDQ